MRVPRGTLGSLRQPQHLVLCFGSLLAVLRGELSPLRILLAVLSLARIYIYIHVSLYVYRYRHKEREERERERCVYTCIYIYT